MSDVFSEWGRAKEWMREALIWRARRVVGFGTESCDALVSARLSSVNCTRWTSEALLDHGCAVPHAIGDVVSSRPLLLGGTRGVAHAAA